MTYRNFKLLKWPVFKILLAVVFVSTSLSVFLETELVGQVAGGPHQLVLTKKEARRF